MYDISISYKKFIWKKTVFILSVLLMLFLLMIFSMTLGSAELSIKEVFYALLSRFSSVPSLKIAYNIVWELRIPRILMAIIAGIAFAASGTCMQAILRNPLASPYTLGIASGAGFGAALSIIGLESFGIVYPEITIISAFVFSLLPSFVIIGLTKFKRATPSTMILSGIAMMYLFSALTSLLQYMGTKEDVTAVVYWLFGNLSKSNWQNLTIVSIITLSLLIMLIKWSPDFNALMYGDETAASLGVNVEKIRILGLMFASLITAAAVSFLGTIGFIGLVSPHITRMIIGADHRFLLPGSSLVGGLLLLASDTAARTILSPVVLPVGILTSFFGVPFFLYLIIKKGNEFW